MFLNSSYGRVVDILHRSMDVSMLRRSVIADNLANADTPNFKKSNVNFKADMKAFEQNSARAASAIKAGDFAYELMDAQGVSNAYEKSCCGSIDAV